MTERSAIKDAKKEGKIEEQENMVINGYNTGFPIETISTFTRLSHEQINEILKRNRII